MKRRMYGLMVTAVFVWLPVLALGFMQHGNGKGPTWVNPNALWWI